MASYVINGTIANPSDFKVGIEKVGWKMSRARGYKLYICRTIIEKFKFFNFNVIKPQAQDQPKILSFEASNTNPVYVFINWWRSQIILSLLVLLLLNNHVYTQSPAASSSEIQFAVPTPYHLFILHAAIMENGNSPWLASSFLLSVSHLFLSEQPRHSLKYELHLDLTTSYWKLLQCPTSLKINPELLDKTHKTPF